MVDTESHLDAVFVEIDDDVFTEAEYLLDALAANLPDGASMANVALHLCLALGILLNSADDEAARTANMQTIHDILEGIRVDEVTGRACIANPECPEGATTH